MVWSCRESHDIWPTTLAVLEFGEHRFNQRRVVVFKQGAPWLTSQSRSFVAGHGLDCAGREGERAVGPDLKQQISRGESQSKKTKGINGQNEFPWRTSGYSYRVKIEKTFKGL